MGAAHDALACHGAAAYRSLDGIAHDLLAKASPHFSPCAPWAPLTVGPTPWALPLVPPSSGSLAALSIKVLPFIAEHPTSCSTPQLPPAEALSPTP
ncbi:unnamed protein product [Ilex paraguariensis]|uniref:Uncharacterized protein n=1 Tax=Ilex paraguariensis TaxID=185542 RepID=A0ABC8UW07_9AQUA